MNGNGCAGSIASGVSSGKMWSRKCSSIQPRSLLLTSCAIDQDDAAFGQDLAQVAPDHLLIDRELWKPSR